MGYGSSVGDAAVSRVSKSDVRELARPGVMWERTVTYTGSDPIRHLVDGLPRPGLVLSFNGDIAPLIGCAIDRPRVFGRGEDADVVIDDGSVSRAHMVVEPTALGMMVRDCKSRNGTYVDGVPIGEAPQLARFGSTVRLGRTLFFVRQDVRPFLDEDLVRYPKLVGGPSLSEVRRRIDLARVSKVPVLIEGETGAGKEVVARAIHEASERDGELVEVNCAAIPSELVESELFGHARGAFSGSDRARVGLFRTADRGTLLLDEIGELPPALQAKLLRVLETGEVRPVGEDRSMTVDVRVVAATNRNLDAMAQKGLFRMDLLHRIAALRIGLSPLRDRREDVPALALHFLGADAPAIGATAMDLLVRYRWPGNARELRHLLAAAAAGVRAAGRTVIDAEDISGLMPVADAIDAAEDDDGRARIIDALGAAGGNVTHAARDLGVARSGLYEALRRLQIDPAAFRPARSRRWPRAL
jgi:hypothetical protein